MEILVYAVKHAYKELMDEAAPYLLSTPLSEMISKLPSHLVVRWVRTGHLRLCGGLMINSYWEDSLLQRLGASSSQSKGIQFRSQIPFGHQSMGPKRPELQKMRQGQLQLQLTSYQAHSAGEIVYFLFASRPRPSIFRRWLLAF